MTTTPRTDALMNGVYENGLPIGRTHRSVLAELARQLETELADTQAQLAEANRLTLRAEASAENYASAAEELRREVNELRGQLAKAEADVANCQRDVHELLRLLCEIRMATGDRGKRNQAELVAYCADLAKRATVLEKVRAYPYIPQGLAALIERELNTTTP